MSKLPPFGAQLLSAHDYCRSVIVATGRSGAWEFAKSTNYDGYIKLVLPFGDDPQAYRWPLVGLDVMVFSFGEPESRERLFSLSRCLIEGGAILVVWCIEGCPMTSFRPERRAA